MKTTLMIWVAALLFMVAPVAASAGSATSEIATIMINLNHYPSSAEKKMLAAIVADHDSTKGEKVIAGALMRMQHRVGDDDAASLMKLEADKSVPASERELATILRSIAHHPTRSDIEKLKGIAK